MQRIIAIPIFFLLFTSCRSENENDKTTPIIDPPITTIPKLIAKITGQNGEYTKFSYINNKISKIEKTSYNSDIQQLTMVQISCDYQNEKISKIYRNNDLFAQLYYDNVGVLNSITYSTNYSLPNNLVKFEYQNSLLKNIIYPHDTGGSMTFTYKSTEIEFYSQWGKRGEVRYDNKINPLSTIDKNLIYGVYLCTPHSNPEFVNYSNNILSYHQYYVNSNYNYTNTFTYEYDNDGFANKKLSSSGVILEIYEYQ